MNKPEEISAREGLRVYTNFQDSQLRVVSMMMLHKHTYESIYMRLVDHHWVDSTKYMSY